MAEEIAEPLVRKQNTARKAAARAYSFRCCVVCGLQMEASLTVAHLDHRAGNNDPGNLAYMCGTHHWMYDCGLYPLAAIKMLRAHWEQTRGVPDHRPRMKDAGIKAARKREYRRRGNLAAATRAKRANFTPAAQSAASVPAPSSDGAASSGRSAAARKAWITRRANSKPPSN